MAGGTDPVLPVKKRIWNNLAARFWTAIIFALVCIIPLYIGGPVWAALVAVLGLRLMWEWVNMSDPTPRKLSFAIPMIGLLVGIAYAGQGEGVLAATALVLAAIAAAIERSPRGGVLWAGLGTLYIIIPTLMIVWLRGPDMGLSATGFQQLLFIILIVVAADTGAYFGGSLLKGPKMAPKLSPNKTWSGFSCGLVFATMIGVLAGTFIGLPFWFAATLSVPIVIFSVIGDFFESGLKRRLNVKDAGDVLPGHGGLLDRLDSLMLAVVAAGVILAVYPQIWPQ